MNPVEVREMLEKVGAIFTGHFRLSSGRHADTYIQKQRIFEHPRLTASLGEAIAARFGTRPGHPPSFNVVVSPAVGAIALGHEVARSANVRFVFTERQDDVMSLRRGQALHPSDHALVVEDVVTTGGSAAAVVELVRSRGVHLVGVAAIVDRSEAELPFPLQALLRMQVPTWDPDGCPLCAAGEPVESPGSRFIP